MLLLSASADVNAIISKGERPLHIALRTKYLEGVKPLLDAGAEVNVANQHGCTPLHYAADKSFRKVAKQLLDVAKLLLDAGAEVNVINRYGYTPLHCAVDTGFPEAVEFLLDAGADLNVKDIWKLTPIDCAIKIKGDLEITKILVNKGAEIPSISNDVFSHMDDKMRAYILLRQKCSALRQMWEMENNTYTFFIQWPPKEVLDTVEKLMDGDNERDRIPELRKK